MGKFSKQFISGGNAFKQIEEVGKTEDKKENTTVVEPVVNETVVVEEPKVEPVKEEEPTKITNYEKPQVIETVEDFNKQTKETRKLVKKETRKQGNKETSLQGNLEKKQPKDYYYGAKHTWTIPDDVWEDIEAYLFLTGEKQVEFVVNCLKEKIEPMRVQIEQVKRLLKTRR